MLKISWKLRRLSFKRRKTSRNPSPKKSLFSIFFLLFLNRGNLYSKDLADVFTETVAKPENFIYTEYVTTLVCIVPKAAMKDFLNMYEKLHSNVIPKSFNKYDYKLEEKEGLCLCSVAFLKISLKSQQELQKEQLLEEQKEQSKRRKIMTPIEEFAAIAKEKLK